MRKVGATTAIGLVPEETTLVQRHMSHTLTTAARYYQAVTGKKEAARGHLLRRKLEGRKSREESEMYEDCEELMRIESEESEVEMKKMKLEVKSQSSTRVK